MFNFGKNKDDMNDPQKALDHGKKTLNTGLTGGLTKAFMGKDFVDKMNNAMDRGQAAMDNAKQAQWVAQGGMDATAEVLSIQDTGTLINMNPVVVLQLKVQPMVGAEFMTTAQATGFQDRHSACRRQNQDQIQPGESYTNCCHVVFRQVQKSGGQIVRPFYFHPTRLTLYHGKFQ